MRTTTLAALLLLASVCAPLVTGLLPPLPWTFPNARVLYQPALVPLSSARAVTPKDMRIMSFFGWTLGGVFVVEWTASPVGPYREVAVLSALVERNFNLGAWASHIVVTDSEAAFAARKLFGLPAFVGAVDFSGAGAPAYTPTDDAEDWAQAWREAVEGLRRVAEDATVAFKYAIGTASPGLSEPAERLRPPTRENTRSRRFLFRGSDSVAVEGWNGWLEDPPDLASQNGGGGGFAVNLPSFSGRLKYGEAGSNGNGIRSETSPTALLRYDLLLGPARGIRLRPPMPTEVLFEDQQPLLEGVLGGPVGLIPCIQVDGVRIVAGQPENIGERALPS